MLIKDVQRPKSFAIVGSAMNEVIAPYMIAILRPHLIARSMDAPGVDTSQKAAQFWSSEWAGESFMAIGMKDEMLGPNVMNHLRTFIKGCPDPLEIPEGGHFVQEAAGPLIAERALTHFGLDKT